MYGGIDHPFRDAIERSAARRVSGRNINLERFSAHLMPRARRYGFRRDPNVDRDLCRLIDDHPDGAFGVLSEDAHLS